MNRGKFGLKKAIFLAVILIQSIFINCHSLQINLFTMGMPRRGHWIAAWFACFAVLLASLAPTISHVLNAVRLANSALSGNLAPLQSHAGEKTPNTTQHTDGQHDLTLHHLDVAHADGAHAHAGMAHSSSTPALPSHGDAGFHFEHCPFCFTHAGSFGLAAAFDATNLRAEVNSIMPGLFYHSPTPLFVWTSTQARAPPSLS